MKMRFWGVRGSVPTPLFPVQVKSKISFAIQRIQVEDLATPESREQFLESLPDWVISTTGGNTACVEVITDDNCRIIFDAGTGIRGLGSEIVQVGTPCSCHIFFSHFHWDHVQGLPFFAPAFNPANTLEFYSPEPKLKEILMNQMQHPYFPITMDIMGSTKVFHTLKGEKVNIGNAAISYRSMNHPGGCWSYKVEAQGRSAIYATDTELGDADFIKNEENTSYFSGVDLLVIDTQYTLGEAIEKNNWGHSSFSLAADFAATWGIKKLVLFHHEPNYDDLKISSIHKSAAAYVDHITDSGVEIILGREGLLVDI